RGRLQQVIPLGAVQLPGAHTVGNARAACLAAALAGASAGAMVEALSAFRGLPYRFGLVADAGGVRYYEDSLATNPTAAAAAIASMDRPLVLIAGGARPNATADDFASMRTALQASPVEGVLLIGATAPQLQEALAGLPVSAVGTLERDGHRPEASTRVVAVLRRGCAGGHRRGDGVQRQRDRGPRPLRRWCILFQAAGGVGRFGHDGAADHAAHAVCAPAPADAVAPDHGD